MDNLVDIDSLLSGLELESENNLHSSNHRPSTNTENGQNGEYHMSLGQVAGKETSNSLSNGKHSCCLIVVLCIMYRFIPSLNSLVLAYVLVFYFILHLTATLYF